MPTTVIPDGPLSARAVGNYLAKYVTKGVTDSGVLDQPIRTSDDLRLVLPLLGRAPAARHQRTLSTLLGVSVLALVLALFAIYAAVTYVLAGWERSLDAHWSRLVVSMLWNSCS